jgi:hypothetical protein
MTDATSAFDDWLNKARAVPIEQEIERRGIQLNGGKVERCGPCPRCGGADRFSINTRKGVWNCRGCDKGGDVIALVEHLDGVDFIAACTTLAGSRPKRDGAFYPPNNRATVQPGGLTLEQYSAAKALPIDFLREHGLSDVTLAGRSAVRIAYLGADGEELAVRFRIAIAGDRFRWKSGSKPCLYGLNRVGEAKAAGYVVLVEGESDVHTLWHHGIPAIGLPGATSWREDRDAEWFDGIETIYVVIEPDKGGHVCKHS